MIETAADEIKLEFDTPQFLHSLFADDLRNPLGRRGEAVYQERAPGAEGIGQSLVIRDIEG